MADTFFRGGDIVFDDTPAPQVATPMFKGGDIVFDDEPPARPPAPAQKNYDTQLTPEEETAYQQWRATLPKELQYEGDYDLRGYWKDPQTKKDAVSGDHFIDKYKKPNHPTFSVESMYATGEDAKKAGRWDGDRFVLASARTRNLLMPGGATVQETQRAAAEADRPTEAQFAQEIAAHRTDAEPETAASKPIRYIGDLLLSVGSGFASGLNTISEAMYRAAGNKSGVEAARQNKRKIEEDLAPELLDTKGGGAVDTALQLGKNIAHVTGEFAPAAIPGMGTAYTATYIPASASNRMAEVYETAKGKGLSDAQANMLATGAGAVDALANMLMMGMFKGVWQGVKKDVAEYVKRSFVIDNVNAALKTGLTMGGQSGANAAIDMAANAKPVDMPTVAEATKGGFAEGFLFHVANSGVHHVAHAIDWKAPAETLAARNARRALNDDRGRGLLYNNSPEAAEEIVRARMVGDDISQEALRKLGIPKEVAPTQADRNAVADTLLRDFREWNSWVEDAYAKERRNPIANLEMLASETERARARAGDVRTALDEAGREIGDERIRREVKSERDATEYERARRRRIEADAEAETFREWNDLFRQGKTDMTFEDYKTFRAEEQDALRAKAEEQAATEARAGAEAERVAVERDKTLIGMEGRQKRKTDAEIYAEQERMRAEREAAEQTAPEAVATAGQKPKIQVSAPDTPTERGFNWRGHDVVARAVREDGMVLGYDFHARNKDGTVGRFIASSDNTDLNAAVGDVANSLSDAFGLPRKGTGGKSTITDPVKLAGISAVEPVEPATAKAPTTPAVEPPAKPEERDAWRAEWKEALSRRRKNDGRRTALKTLQGLVESARLDDEVWNPAVIREVYKKGLRNHLDSKPDDPFPEWHLLLDGLTEKQALEFRKAVNEAAGAKGGTEVEQTIALAEKAYAIHKKPKHATTTFLHGDSVGFNKGGLKLGDLERLHENKYWQKALGLPEAETKALDADIERAYVASRLNDKYTALFQAMYPRKKLARTKQEKMENLADIIDKVNDAITKETDKEFSESIKAIKDEYDAKVNALSAEDKEIFKTAQQTIEDKKNSMANPSSVDANNASQNLTKDGSGTTNKSVRKGVSRNSGGTKGERVFTVESVDGDNVTVVQSNRDGDVVQTRTFSRQALNALAKVEPAWKAIADNPAPGQKIRRQIDDASPEARALRYATDADYAEYLKRKGKVDSESMRDAYDRESATAAAQVAKNHVAGAKVKYENADFAPPASGEGSPDVRYLRNTQGRVVGTFNRATNEVTLYRGANAKTVTHELGGHAMRLAAEQAAANGDRRLLDRIERAEREAPKDIVDEIRRKYPDADEQTLKDEIWAALRERHNKAVDAALKTRQGREWYARAWLAMKDAWRSLLTRLGYNRADISRIDSMSNDEFLDFLDEAMAKGKTVAKLAKPTGSKPTMERGETFNELRTRKMSDRYDPWRVLGDELRAKSGGKEIADPYYAMRVRAGHDEADKRRIDSIEREYMDFMRKHHAEITTEDMGAWLRAKDALFRNPDMEKRLGVKDGAGISTDRANEIKNKYIAEGKESVLEEGERILRQLQQEFGLKQFVESGMLDAETAELLHNRNRDYVPQMTDMNEDGEFDRNLPRSLEASAIKRAFGRKTEADNPVGFMFEMARSNAARINKNRVRQEIAKLVRQFPELGRTRAQNYTSDVDAKGEKVWVHDKYDGEAHNPNLIAFREHGKKTYIELDGKRGELLAQAARDEGIRRAYRPVQATTAALASTATRFSWTFGGRNMVKDTADAAAALALDLGWNDAARFLKNQTAGAKKAIPLLWKFNRTGEITDEMKKTREGKVLDLMVKKGALIGGMTSEGYQRTMRKLENAQRTFREKYEKANVAGKTGLVVGESFNQLFKKIDGWNGVIELLTRYSDFYTRLEATGKIDKLDTLTNDEIKKAVIGAREDLTDFNKWGQWRVMNDIYMFANSTMGSTVRALKLLNKSATQGKLDRIAVLVGVGAVGAMLRAALRSDDEGDKNMTERDRAENLFNIRVGEHTYRIPMHRSPYSLLMYTGDCLTRAAMGEMSWSDAAKNLTKEAATVASHLSGAGEIDLSQSPKGVLNQLTPSLVRPFAELANNRNYADKPIYQTPISSSDTRPRSEMSFANTGEGWKMFARAMNAVGNAIGLGDEGTGTLDNPPEVYRYLAESVTKNFGRDVSDFFSTGARAVESAVKRENKMEIEDVPFVGDFVRNVPDNTRRYQDAKASLAKPISNYKEADYKKRIEMAKEMPALATYGYLEKLSGRIDELRHRERGEVRRGRKWVKPDTPVSDKLIEEYTAQRVKLQKEYLDFVERKK